MTIYFSKTQHIEFDHWEVTISPNCIKKGYTPEKGDWYSDEEVVALVEGKPKNNTVILRVVKGIPCVGRGYTIERK